MINFTMIGAAGRMGRSIIALAPHEDLKLNGAMEHVASVHLNQDAGTLASGNPSGVLITSDPDTALKNSQVVIDFSSPETSLRIASICRKQGIGLVVGTTGFSDEQKKEMISASKDIALLMAPNMSLGVNVLFYLTELVSTMLGSSADIEIIEAHHRHKRDAPSGTAIRLKDVILEAMSRSEEDVVYGRKGITGERDPHEIGVHAVRGGDTVGDHTVFYYMDGERLELTHRASSRNNFARGALKAASFIALQKPGNYTMKNVLNLD